MSYSRTNWVAHQTRVTAEALNNIESGIVANEAAAAGALKATEQSLTAAQKAQALANLGAASGGDLAALRAYVRSMSPVATVAACAQACADDAAPLDAEAVVIHIRPAQAGSGDPGAQNVRALTGRTSVTLYHSGEDVSDPQTHAIALPSAAGTVYGGTLDVTAGTLSVFPYYASYGGQPLTGPWISSMDVYAENAAPTAGAQVVDLGGTATVYALDAQSVALLRGVNKLWSDAGDTALTYRRDLGLILSTEGDATGVSF